jgi:hypothetical protein
VGEATVLFRTESLEVALGLEEAEEIGATREMRVAKLDVVVLPRADLADIV